MCAGAVVSCLVSAAVITASLTPDAAGGRVIRALRGIGQCCLWMGPEDTGDGNGLASADCQRAVIGMATETSQRLLDLDLLQPRRAGGDNG